MEEHLKKSSLMVKRFSDIPKDAGDLTQDAKRNTENAISSEWHVAKNANAKLALILRLL